MKTSKDALRSARQMLRLSLVDGAVDADRVRKIIRKVADGKPRGYLQILGGYLHLLRLELEKRQAMVETAVELQPATRQSVEAELQRKYGGDLTFSFAINPELLGGMRVKVGSDIWDGSVKSRIERLKQAFS